MANQATQTIGVQTRPSRASQGPPRPVRTRSSGSPHFLPTSNRPALGPLNQQSATDRPYFRLVCLYLFSQAYLLPLAMIGPSWATWPNFADLICFAAGLLFLIGRPSPIRVTPAVDSVRRWTWAMATLACLSVVFVGWALPCALYDVGPDQEAVEFGIFQSYRLFQFAAIVDCACRFRWTNERRRSLRRITLVALFVNCATVFATFLKFVEPAFYAPHLTADPTIGGPWAFYQSTADAWGVAGYNHAYTAIQIVMLTAAWLTLCDRERSTSSQLIMLLSTSAVLVSNSRAGLVAAVIFVAFLWLQRPAIAIIAGCFLIPLSFTVMPTLSSGDTDVANLLQRQSSVLDAGNAENLSGRDSIWRHWLGVILDRPDQWLFGAGFGATSGDSAHMQPLHMFIEVGVVGVILFTMMFCQILRGLWIRELAPKPMFWALIGILPTLLTQETLYPVHAMGHFCGLTLVAIVMTLQRAEANSRDRNHPFANHGPSKDR